MPNANEIRDTVVEVLRCLVHECPDHLEDSVCPIAELGLTSKDGAEFAIELEERLGCHIEKVLNPLIDDDRRQPRTLGDIAEWLGELLLGQQKGLLCGRNDN